MPSPCLAFRSAGETAGFKGTEKVRWHNSSIHLDVRDETPPGIEAGDVQSIAEIAFERWSEAAQGRVSAPPPQLTHQAAAREDQRNTITFVFDGWERVSADPQAAAATDVGYTRTARGEWAITEADIYLNAEEHTWSAGSSTDASRDLDAVLTHEIGHMLGLMHPCETAGADGAPDCSEHPEMQETTMYPLYSAEQSSLKADDVAGINFLYERLSCDRDPCSEGQVCSQDGCLEPCNDLVCNAGEYCTAEGCLSEFARPKSEGSCVRTADCRDAEQCLAGRCVAAPIATGDVCQRSEQCASGVCANQGFCVNACTDCVGGACTSDEGGALTCAAARFPLGSECQKPEDCLGDQCLRGAEQANVCTSVCDGAINSCPNGWECTSVDGTTVCAPLGYYASGGGGCHMATMNHSNPAQLAAGLGYLCLPTWAAWRRRRSGRRRGSARKRIQ